MALLSIPVLVVLQFLCIWGTCSQFHGKDATSCCASSTKESCSSVSESDTLKLVSVHSDSNNTKTELLEEEMATMLMKEGVV